MFQIGAERVALVTDSACDLSNEILARHDISLVPLRISTRKGDLRDRVDIQPEELYPMLKEELPKTSLPQPEDVISLYRSLRERGCTRILHIAMSSGLSGTFNMVRMMAADMDDLRIDVVDSLTLSAGLGLLVTEAAECLTEGMSVEDTMTRVNRLRKSQLGAFVIRTLEYLRKGGRIGLVEGVVGSLLQIKPVIYVNQEGVYQTLTKARGFGSAVEAMSQEFFRRFEGKNVRLAIVHGNAPEDAKRLRDQFVEQLQVVSATIAPVSPALAIHTGPGLVGAIVQMAE